MTNAAVQKEAIPLAGGLTPVNVQTLAKLSMLSLTKPDMGTDPAISGQLRLALSELQTLHNSYGVTQSRLGHLTYSSRFDYRETQEMANPLMRHSYNDSLELADWMMLFNSDELPESSNSLISSKSTNGGHRPIKGDYCSCSLKPENYSGSAEHYRYSDSTEHNHYLGSPVIRCGCTYVNQQPTDKEKDSTVNAAIEMVLFFNHEENHQYPALEDDSFFSHLENQHLAKLQDNQPSLRGLARYLCVAKRYAQNLLSLSEPDSITRSKSVQISEFSDSIKKGSYVNAALRSCASVDHSSGASGFVLRRSALSLRPHASRTHEEKLASGFSARSRSMLISISSMISCGNRIPLYEDLLFLCPVAIASTHEVILFPNDNTGMPKTKEVFKHKQVDMFKHCKVMCLNTLSTGKAQEAQQIATPRTVRAVPRRLTKPLTGVTTMAGSQHTQTHPKFTWRFLALNANTRSVIRITAATEREARDQSPAGCVMVFAGRLPVQEVRHA